MQHNANTSVQLTNEQKIFLRQTAFDCGYHPKQRVKMIRYKYQGAKRFMDKNKKKVTIKANWYWQVLTEANNTFKVKDKWCKKSLAMFFFQFKWKTIPEPNNWTFSR